MPNNDIENDEVNASISTNASMRDVNSIRAKYPKLFFLLLIVNFFVRLFDICILFYAFIIPSWFMLKVWKQSIIFTGKTRFQSIIHFFKVQFLAIIFLPFIFASFELFGFIVILPHVMRGSYREESDYEIDPPETWIWILWEKLFIKLNIRISESDPNPSWVSKILLLVARTIPLPIFYLLLFIFYFFGTISYIILSIAHLVACFVNIKNKEWRSKLPLSFCHLLLLPLIVAQNILHSLLYSIPKECFFGLKKGYEKQYQEGFKIFENMPISFWSLKLLKEKL